MSYIGRQLFEVKLCTHSHLNLRLDHLCYFFNQFTLMIFVEIVLFSEVFLHSSNLTSHIGFLFFSSTSFCLKLFHHISELIFHCHMQRSDTLLLFHQLVFDDRIHGIIFSFVLHLFIQLFFIH